MINEEQRISAQKIIKVGLEESAKSLAYFTKSETEISLNKEFTIIEKPQLDKEILDKKGELFLLSTELIGDMQGVAYLIFSREEVKNIASAFYEGRQFDEEKFRKKSEALIMEITNIITAAVVSQFANYFNYHTYGDVPQMEITEPRGVAKIIEKQLSRKKILVDFRARLLSKEIDVNPEFIWFVDDSFIKGLSNLKEVH